MTVIEKAMRTAALAHKEQVRKSDGSPYIAHPFMVAMKLKEHGFDDAVIAAALLHDTLEDTSVTEDQLRNEVGDEITDIIVALTEDKSLPWHDRKKEYIASVKTGSEAVKAVSVSDKIHNLESVLDGYQAQGPTFWEKFNKGKEDKLWFEHKVLKALKETWAHPLIEEYESLIGEMETLD